jgi:hypothetical protein
MIEKATQRTGVALLAGNFAIKDVAYYGEE